MFWCKGASGLHSATARWLVGGNHSTKHTSSCSINLCLNLDAQSFLLVWFSFINTTVLHHSYHTVVMSCNTYMTLLTNPGQLHQLPTAQHSSNQLPGFPIIVMIHPDGCPFPYVALLGPYVGICPSHALWKPQTHWPGHMSWDCLHTLCTCIPWAVRVCAPSWFVTHLVCSYK